MKKSFILFLFLGMVVFAFSQCGGSDTQTNSDATDQSSEAASADPETYDPKRGEGKFNEENVIIGAEIDGPMAESGEKAYGVKCSSCHKLTDERLVGPGWKGVSTKHTPYWIMNFITNPDAMIDKDPQVQAQLELCLVRMPNQNLADQEARDLLEFMRKNDK